MTMDQRPLVTVTLSALVKRFGGSLLGDGDVVVNQVATLENAVPGTITFLANERYLAQLKDTRASAVIIGKNESGVVNLPRIVTDNPYAYFARVSALLNPEPGIEPGIHPTAVVHASASLGNDVSIAAQAVIEAHASIGSGSRIGAGCFIGMGSKIGEAAILHPRVTVYHGCHVGDRAIIHSGAVIGADGFGIAMDNGQWVKVPQIGGVCIGDDVEIGANTTIDRGAIDDTVIEDDVKLDNQIQIAHNVHIGAHTAIAACVGIAGSSRVGRYCRIGGASGIAGHLTIADHVEISAHTLVTKSIMETGTYTGAYPFELNRNWRRNAATLRNLGDLAERVRQLERDKKTLVKGKP